jgi:lipoyl(octanoyl) transferase
MPLTSPRSTETIKPSAPAIDWHVSDRPIEYRDALAAMEARVEAIARGEAAEMIWLLEHSPLYTAGTSARSQDLLTPERFPVHAVGRGGQYTYHGPGQRVAYVMMDLRRRGGDVRAFVENLEGWLIDTLAAFNVRGERREGRVGVWVARPAKGSGVEDKIAALGIRVRRGVTFHGVSLNVEPDLEHFSGIVPCGIDGFGSIRLGVTSLADLGLPVTMHDADVALRHAFETRFGRTRLVAGDREIA